MFSALYPPAYRGGGPVRTTYAMAKTHSVSTRFRIVTSNLDWGEAEPLDVEPDQWIQRNEGLVWYTGGNALSSFLRATCSARENSPDFVYLNSFFNPVFSILPSILFKLRFFGEARLIVAPRGEFGSAAREYKSLKKDAFVNFCRLVGLHARTTWHASSEVEAADIRRAFPSSNVIVRINESTLPAQALRRPIRGSGPIRLMFVSRVAEIKGVAILLRALRGIQRFIVLDIYGPSDDEAYLECCQGLAEALPDNIQVRFNGGVENSQVRELFADADAFFLPTEQENFGHAIAESLSAGCPVYVADVTPWTEVIRSGGGSIVPSREVDAWHLALVEFCDLSPEQRRSKKLAAADAYEKWRANQHGPSIFELAAQQ